MERVECVRRGFNDVIRCGWLEASEDVKTFSVRLLCSAVSEGDGSLQRRYLPSPLSSTRLKLGGLDEHATRWKYNGSWPISQ